MPAGPISEYTGRQQLRLSNSHIYTYSTPLSSGSPHRYRLKQHLLPGEAHWIGISANQSKNTPMPLVLPIVSPDWTLLQRRQQFSVSVSYLVDVHIGYQRALLIVVASTKFCKVAS